MIQAVEMELLKIHPTALEEMEHASACCLSGYLGEKLNELPTRGRQEMESLEREFASVLQEAQAFADRDLRNSADRLQLLKADLNAASEPVISMRIQQEVEFSQIWSEISSRVGAAQDGSLHDRL